MVDDIRGKSPWELVMAAVGENSIMPNLEVVEPQRNEREYIMSTERLVNGPEISIEALKEAVQNREIERRATLDEAERLFTQVQNFREDAKQKVLEINAINETIEYLQNRNGKPQFVNERLNRMNEGSGVNVGQINVQTGQYFTHELADELAGKHVADSYEPNPQAHQSACADNDFGAEKGNVADRDNPNITQGQVHVRNSPGYAVKSHGPRFPGEIGDVQRVQGDLGYDNGCGCDPQG